MIAPNVEPFFSHCAGFFGAPDTDKGTQGNFIDEKSGISQISAGDTLCIQGGNEVNFHEDDSCSRTDGCRSRIGNRYAGRRQSPARGNQKPLGVYCRTEIEQFFIDDAIGVSLNIREWKV
jgi:hypothetical protein